jgi:phosphoglycerol transferase MdoB-like AlkP superfamily enzyme
MNMISTILNRKFYKNCLLGFVVFFFVWAFIHRMLFGYLTLRPHVDDFRLISLSIFRQDALILGISLFLYVLSSILRNTILKISLRLILLLFFLLYWLDLAVFRIFHTRLSLTDLFQYMPDITFLPGLFSVSIFTGIVFVVFFLLFVLSSIVFVLHQGPKHPKIAGLILMVAFAAAGFHFSGKSNSYFIHAWMFKNFIEINLGRGLDTPYSKEFIETALKKAVDEKITCVERTAPKPRKNIILLILESFSMHHSRFFSGINDYTPNLDRIASEGRAFTNFISNGFTTEHGLIALFTGQFPIPGIKESQYNFFSDSYKGYYDLEHTLPKILTRNGYYSEFLTSGHLGFSNKGAWLENIGFDYFEGHDADLYKGRKRFHFQSVPDDVLYERVLARLKEIEAQGPYFMAIETVSTHLPFTDPITEKRSEPLAVQFADTALGDFYDTLKKTDFFDTGMLIIVSDHRSMDMVPREELDLFGPKAPALVPLVIIGSEYTGVEKSLFQQTDIFTSIENYVSGKSCTSEFSGDLLNIPSTPPAFAVYVRGDDRSLISVFTEKTHATLRLEGNRTGLMDGEINDVDYIVRKINFDRISRNASNNP